MDRESEDDDTGCRYSQIPRDDVGRLTGDKVRYYSEVDWIRLDVCWHRRRAISLLQLHLFTNSQNGILSK